jgi:predicted DNA-binding transcriptional regulator AlpA
MLPILTLPVPVFFLEGGNPMNTIDEPQTHQRLTPTAPVIPPHYSILLNVEQLALYLGGISTRKVWALVSAGKLPAPKKIDRLTRWRRSDIDRWVVLQRKFTILGSLL